MHHSHYSKTLPGQLHVPLVDCTFLHYQAGRLDGFDLGYRQGVTDTGEDADWRRLTRAVGTFSEVVDARREAGEWARQHCTYAGGPVNFFTGRPVNAEKEGAA